MYRNPAERLLSAYRSKLENYPILSQKRYHSVQIFQFTRPQEYKKWVKSGRKENIKVKFPEFVQYWLHLIKTKKLINVHFKPIFDICKPCQVRYNYYGNFMNFNHDAEVLLRHQGANLSLLREGYYDDSGITTRKIAPQYYRQLSDEQKIEVVDGLALELSFYYSIFPEEKDTHKTLMETDYDVPDLLQH